MNGEGFIFKKIGGEKNLDNEILYPIDGNGVDCVSVRKGKLMFGKTNIKAQFFRSKRNRRFWLIPEEAKYVSFPDFKEDFSGFSYGEPIFFF